MILESEYQKVSRIISQGTAEIMFIQFHGYINVHYVIFICEYFSFYFLVNLECFLVVLSSEGLLRMMLKIMRHTFEHLFPASKAAYLLYVGRLVLNSWICLYYISTYLHTLS